MTGRYRDGLVQISFIRKVVTNDASYDVPLDECKFFLFPVEGGTYNAVNKKIRKHEKVPIVSAERVCISRPKRCHPLAPKKPAEIRYEFDIKLTGGLGDNWQPPKQGSEDFQLLENRIKRDLESELKSIEGFNRIGLTGIKK